MSVKGGFGGREVVCGIGFLPFQCGCSQSSNKPCFSDSLFPSKKWIIFVELLCNLVDDSKSQLN